MLTDPASCAPVQLPAAVVCAAASEEVRADKLVHACTLALVADFVLELYIRCLSVKVCLARESGTCTNP